MARGSPLSSLSTTLGVAIIVVALGGFGWWAMTLDDEPTAVRPGSTSQPPPAPAARPEATVAPPTTGRSAADASASAAPERGTMAAETAGTAGTANMGAMAGAGPVRDITPTGMTPPPAVTGPLNRKPGKEPPAPPPERIIERRLPLPIVETAGSLKVGELTLVIDGIEAPAPDAVCTDQAAKAWPCGIKAASALKALVRSRAVTCVVGERQATGTVATRCRIGKTDLATWLVENGWADPIDGGPLAALRDQARQEGRGRFRTQGDEPLPASAPVAAIEPSPMPMMPDSPPEPTRTEPPR